MAKVKMTSNHSKIFKGSDELPPPEYPFSDKIIDDWSGDEACPFCNKPLANHDVREGVRCALNVLRGEKE